MPIASLHKGEIEETYIQSSNCSSLHFEVPPVALRSFIVLSSLNQLFVLLYGGCYSVQGDALQLVPVIDQRQDFLDSGSEVGVGSEHVPHKILHLLRLLMVFVLDAGVDDAEFAFLLEGVVAIVEDEEHTPKHPDVDAIVDGVFEVEVDHFGRTVHEGGVLLEPLFIVIQLALAHLLEVDALLAAAPQVTKLEHALLCHQDVLYLDILMEYSQTMHLLQSQSCVLEDSQNLGLWERLFLLLGLRQKVEYCLFSQLHQDVALKKTIFFDGVGAVVADDVRAPRTFLHDFHLILEVEFLLISLADEFFESVVAFGIDIFDQEHVAVSSFCNQVELFEALAVDIEVARSPEQPFDKLKATSHLLQCLYYQTSKT